MKRKLILAACIVVIAVVGILSVQAYNHYRRQRNAVAAQAALQAKGEAQQKATFNAQVEKLDALCQRDYQAYQALTPAQKAKQQAPNCSLQFVQ